MSQPKKYGQPLQHLGASITLLHLRATTFGITYGDLLQANRKGHNWASWSRALVTFAERYEALGCEALAQGRLISAEKWLRMTVNYYHFAQMFQRGDAKAACQTKCWHAFAQLAPLLEPKAQRVAIPFEGAMLPGWLRVAHPGAPCVMILGGFEFGKETELQQVGDYFVERGLSVLTFDGPGQGEMATQLSMRGDFDVVVSAAIDHLATLDGLVDANRIGLVGISLGGYMVCRAAAQDARVAGVVSISGNFDGRAARNLAPRNQQVMAGLFGFDTLAPLFDPDGPFSLARLPQGMTQPLLLVHGSADHVVPYDQIELFQEWSHGKTDLWVLEQAEHCCFSRMEEVLPHSADWMVEQI